MTERLLKSLPETVQKTLKVDEAVRGTVRRIGSSICLNDDLLKQPRNRLINPVERSARKLYRQIIKIDPELASDIRERAIVIIAKPPIEGTYISVERHFLSNRRIVS